MYGKPPLRPGRYSIGRPPHRSVTEASATTSTWSDARSRTMALTCCHDANIARALNEDEPHRKSLNIFVEELHDDLGPMESASRHLFRSSNEREGPAYLRPQLSSLDLSTKPEKGPVSAPPTEVPKTLELGDGPPTTSVSNFKSLDCLQSGVGHRRLRLNIPSHRRGLRSAVGGSQSLPRIRLKKATSPTQDVKPRCGADDGQSLDLCSWRATRRLSHNHLLLDKQGPVDEDSMLLRTLRRARPSSPPPTVTSASSVPPPRLAVPLPAPRLNEGCRNRIPAASCWARYTVVGRDIEFARIDALLL